MKYLNFLRERYFSDPDMDQAKLHPDGPGGLATSGPGA